MLYSNMHSHTVFQRPPTGEIAVAGYVRVGAVVSTSMQHNSRVCQICPLYGNEQVTRFK